MSVSSAAPVDVEGVDAAKAREIVAGWLASLQTAMAARDIDQILELFTADAGWRDIVAFSWHIRSYDDPNEMRQAL